MSYLLAVAQEKGGTRKTWLAAHLAAYCRKHGLLSPLELVDADISQGFFQTVCPDVRSVPFNLDEIFAIGRPCALDALIEAMRSGENLLVDFGANSMRGLWFFFHRRHQIEQELEKMECEVVFFCPIGSDAKSRESFEAIEEHFRWAQVIPAFIEESNGVWAHAAWRRELAMKGRLFIDIPYAPRWIVEFYLMGLTLYDMLQSPVVAQNPIRKMSVRHALGRLERELRKMPVLNMSDKSMNREHEGRNDERQGLETETKTGA